MFNFHNRRKEKNRLRHKVIAFQLSGRKDPVSFTRNQKVPEACDPVSGMRPRCKACPCSSAAVLVGLF